MVLVKLKTTRIEIKRPNVGKYRDPLAPSMTTKQMKKHMVSVTTSTEASARKARLGSIQREEFEEKFTENSNFKSPEMYRKRYKKMGKTW